MNTMTEHRRAIWALTATAATAAWGCPALAQGGPVAVEQGSADVDPLASPLRLERADLREATGFERVYRAADGLFARVDGGLTAFFARSEYTPTAFGEVPEVPAGTTWAIGSAPAWYAERFGLLTLDEGERAPARANPNRINLRVPTPLAVWTPRFVEDPAPRAPALVELPEAGVEAVAAPVRDEELVGREPATPWGTDAERARVVSALLMDALLGRTGERRAEVDDAAE